MVISSQLSSDAPDNVVAASWPQTADVELFIVYPLSAVHSATGEAMGMSKGVALALAVVMVAVNFFSTAPVVPTLPHMSWSAGAWFTPWPAQIATAQADEGDYGGDYEYVEAISYQDLERILIGLAIGYLFGWFVDSFEALMDYLTP